MMCDILESQSAVYAVAGCSFVLWELSAMVPRDKGGHTCMPRCVKLDLDFPATWAGPLIARSDDFDPAFDDFRPNALEPADQFIDHVKEHTVTARFKAL
jgi:hypothetical protein